jgi:hypothetical protein
MEYKSWSFSCFQRTPFFHKHAEKPVFLSQQTCSPSSMEINKLFGKDVFEKIGQ